MPDANVAFVRYLNEYQLLEADGVSLDFRNFYENEI
jgi:hypothetical protein